MTFVKSRMYLLLFTTLCPLLLGISGEEETHVFISFGENVRLSCNNALPDCKSTTWIYNKDGNKPTVELITLGIKKNDTNKHERLSLESDCSLNIKKVTKEDYGLYSCQQYVNGKQYGTDARVYLHVLHVSVSSSSSQTEIRPGLSVTLSCQLNSYYGFSCDYLVQFEEIQLIWVNQANVSEMTDSRYQILFLPSYCTSTLTTTLLNEDHNREWRCQLIQRNKPKTSASYTVKYSAQDDTTTAAIPIRFTTSGNTTESQTQVIVIPAVAAVLALVLVAVFWVLSKKRADNKRQIYSSVVKDGNENKETYETINMSIPSTSNANEQTDDVTYCEVTSSSTGNKQVKMDNDHSTVTYATIRGTQCAAQDGLYASVNKNKH